MTMASQLLLAMFFSFVLSSAAMSSSKVNLDGGNYNASWYHDEATDTLNFTVVVKATGWVGFGFSVNKPPPNMIGYDVAVAGVQLGNGYIIDYITNGTVKPKKDDQQDFNLTYHAEAGGITTLMFTRKRDTGDSGEDVVIKVGMPMYLIWAYHATSDANSVPNLTQHSKQGFTEVIFIQAPPVMKFDKEMSFDGGAFRAYWSYHNDTDTLRFKLVVNATGWISFGFAKARGGMVNYDVTVGGVLSGEGYLQDYLTRALGKVPADSQQDFKLIYSSEENGQTTLMYYRKRDTGDKEDVIIEGRQKYFLVWAYTNSADKTPGGFPQHDRRGGTAQAIEIISQDTAPVIEYDKEASFDSGNFKAYWMYDSGVDMLRIKLVVKATGWISLGFATRAPSGMTDYDIAIGGVLSGTGYLQDYITRTFGDVRTDTQQDFTLVYSSEKDGVTTLMYNRKRDTGDSKQDLIIEGKQKYFLVWAYTYSEDVTPGKLPEHNKKGSSPQPIEIISQDTAPVIKYDKEASFDSGNFQAYWMYDSNMDMLRFKLVVKATGWISFGFAKSPSGMVDYDVSVGGVWNGNGYLQDYLTGGIGRVPADSQQDLTLVSSSEKDGVTTLMYNRKRDTGDDKDLLIESKQKYFLVWAYTDSKDKTPGDFPQHNKRGSSPQAMEIISQDTPTPTTYRTTTSFPADTGLLDALEDLEEAKKERDLLKVLVAVSLGIVVLIFVIVIIGFAYLNKKVRIGPATDSKL